MMALPTKEYIVAIISLTNASDAADEIMEFYQIELDSIEEDLDKLTNEIKELKNNLKPDVTIKL